jgi:hypothetical protein
MFDTAVNIINDAAVELGLIPYASKVANPFTSQDSNLGQLCQLLKSVGRKLVRETQWTGLTQTHTFNTVLNQGRYALPSDFDRVIDNTGWNRSNRLALGGPLSPQEFEFFKARQVGVVFNLLWRLLQGKFHAFTDNTTPGGYAIAFEYVSRWWVLPQPQPSATQWLTNTVYSANAYVFNAGNVYQTTTGGTSGATAPTHTSGTVSDGGVQWTYVSAYVGTTSGPWINAATFSGGTVINNAGSLYKTTAGGTSGSYGPTGTGSGISDGGISDWAYQTPAGTDAPTAPTDTLQLDSILLVKALKLAFLKAKGFDSAAVQDEYDSALDQAKNADKTASVLSLTRSTFVEPLLGVQNIPITGVGQ